MEERLIEAVRGFPLLYNKALREFRDRGKKQRAWKEVAAAVGVEESLCQTRWRSLRYRYVREASKKPASGSGTVDDAGKWKYMEVLSFLSGHCCPRKTFGNSKEDASDWFEETDDIAEYLVESLEVEVDLQESGEPTKKKKPKVVAEESFSELCQVVKDLVSSQTMTSIPESRNAGFLQMLDSYLLKLPESVQDRVKVKLICEVQKEIENYEY